MSTFLVLKGSRSKKSGILRIPHLRNEIGTAVKYSNGSKTNNPNIRFGAFDSRSAFNGANKLKRTAVTCSSDSAVNGANTINPDIHSCHPNTDLNSSSSCANASRAANDGHSVIRRHTVNQYAKNNGYLPTKVNYLPFEFEVQKEHPKQLSSFVFIF